MNIQTTRINTANALAKGLIAIEDLEQKLNQIAQKVSKTIKMAGFRQGKVPVSIVKTRYKDSIEQDAQGEMVQDMLNTALKDLKIDAKQLIGDPIITKFEKGEKNIDVEIKISILPEFDVSDALKSIPEPKIPTASPKQIQERLDMLARSQAPIVDSTSKVVKKGHIANIDFEGFVDNVAFEGGKAQGFDLDIGSNQFIPGFEDALVGAKVGEEKEIQVDFPQDYHSANLAGKKATFKVKINTIKDREKIELNDEFAKKVLHKEDASLDELKQDIQKQLDLDLKNKYYSEEMREKSLEALNKAFSFDVPDLIVEQEMDMLFRNSLSQIAKDELAVYQKDPKKAQEKRETFRDEAHKSVKVTFIIDALAKKNNIDVTDNEVMSAIYYESMMSGQDPQQVIVYYKENNFLPAIKMSMIENRVLTRLLDEKANLKDTKDTKGAKVKADSASKAESTESKIAESKKPKKAKE